MQLGKGDVHDGEFVDAGDAEHQQADQDEPQDEDNQEAFQPEAPKQVLGVAPAQVAETLGCCLQPHICKVRCCSSAKHQMVAPETQAHLLQQ